MVHTVATREQSESVKEFEDGVARLVDGHHYYPVFEASQSVKQQSEDYGICEAK